MPVFIFLIIFHDAAQLRVPHFSGLLFLFVQHRHIKLTQAPHLNWFWRRPSQIRSFDRLLIA
jgi:hypothetical protein